MKQDLEIWEPVKGFEDLYQVSSLGNVKGIWNRNLRPDKLWSGHLLVTLYKNATKRRFKVHQLVCLAFLPNPINKPFINHIDNNPANNRIENLEWCTPSENLIHAYKTGNAVGLKNESHPNCKLSNDQINEIRRLRLEGHKLLSIAISYNISFQHVSKIVNNKRRAIEDFEFTKRQVRA